MARYIDADKLIDTLKAIQQEHSPNLTKATNEAIDLGLSLSMRKVREQPTADVVEVKHGKWVDKFNRNRIATQSFCSVCGNHSGIGGIESNRHKPYCPNCGAKMDGEE